MYERLSKRVEHVVKLANQIAREYQQEYVGTEHVLLAIAREGRGVGAQVLAEHGIDETKLRRQIDELLKRSMEDTWVFGRLPGTPHYRNVIAKAIEEARKLKASEVCTEHLLLALLAERGSVAHNALRALGLKLTEARKAVARRCGARGSPQG